tara:strand:+ start:5284 stop:7269 length:1986 start_codon:yes stop_codon:yes gene_type:complete
MTRIEVNFTDPEQNVYRIEINDPDFNGAKTTVQGRATLSYPKTKTMEILRGSTLKMELEASTDTSYYSFLADTVGDAKLPVLLYRNGNIHWSGFIKPDGIVESFVNDYWILSVQALDGLGYLENTSFVKEDGFAFSGPMKELDILAKCLSLTGQELNFRLYDFNIYFTQFENIAPVINQTPITDTFINTDRFKQTDKSSSPFSVKEVLESLLKKYGAFVTQQDGVWNIVRLIDYFSKSITMQYFEFDVDGAYTGNTASPDRVFTLGSQINNFYPHHANANQQKYYTPSLGAYKALYKYGFVESVMLNSNLVFNNTDGDIDNWNLLSPYGGPDYIEFRSTRDGFQAVFETQKDENWLCLESDQSQRVEERDILTIEAETVFDVRVLGTTEHRAFIQLIGDDGINYYLNDENPAKWGTDQTAVRFFSKTIRYEPQTTGTQSFKVDCQDCPVGGVLKVQFLLPSYNGDTSATSFGSTRINRFSIKAKQLNVEGESFIASRIGDENNTSVRNVSAVVEKTEDIFVGDNQSDIYNGSIEDLQGRNTIYWSKKIVNGTIDTKKRFPLLNWLVRDRLQISSGNSLTFSGGVYGYLPYLSVIQIDNIGVPIQNPVKLHLFMTSKYSYDLSKNIMTIDYVRIFQNNIDNDVNVSGPILEGSKVVKPLIRG